MLALDCRTSPRALALVLALASSTLAACGTPQAEESTSGEPTAGATDSDTTPSESSESSESSSSTETETGDSDTQPTAPTDSGPFPDMPIDPMSCDLWAQDCAPGQKCVPYVSGPGQSYDAFKCVDVQGDQAPGEPCTSVGPSEAIDDCDATSICFNLTEEGEGFTGNCVAQCVGTPEMPSCEGEAYCSLSGDSSLALCFPLCNPLEQSDCGEGFGCYWAGQNFTCLAETQNLPTGADCGFLNDCAPGLVCLVPEFVPGCEGSPCCAPFCDIEQGDQPCEEALPGTSCVSFWEDGMAEPGYENVGVCITPEP